MRRLFVTLAGGDPHQELVTVDQCWLARHRLRAMEKDHAATSMIAVDTETDAPVYTWDRKNGVTEDLLETLLWAN